MPTLNVDGKIEKIGPIYVATYKCLAEKSQEDHVIGTLDAGLYGVPAIRDAWSEFVKETLVAIGSLTIELSGGEIEKFSVVEMRDLN